MRLFLTFAFFCCLILPLAAHARSEILDIQTVKSAGGIEAWLVEDHSLPVIAVEFSFKGAGAILETDDKQGLSLMLSNTMDEGAGDLDLQAFQKELRDRSITLHFSSSRDDFGGSLKTLSDNKERAFELLNLALAKPRFDQDAIDRMRAANESRIRSSLSDPEWIAARLLNDVAFKGHPYARNSGGTLTTLAAISQDDLKRFHNSYLGKNNLHVVVAGDITKEELGKVLDQIFGKMPAVKIPAGKPLKLDVQGSVNIYKKFIPQTIVEILQPGIDRKDPDYQTAQVMNFILGASGFGSRLTKEIRENRGLTYGIYSGFQDMEYFDGMSVSSSTRNETAAEMLSLVKVEWDKIKTAPVTDEELKSAKSYMTGSLPLALTSTDSIASMMLSIKADGLPINYLDLRQRQIEKVTAADIQRVANRILDTNKMTTILVGVPTGLENAKIMDTFLPNVQ